MSELSSRLTVPGFVQKKTDGEKIAVVTAYDYLTARIVDASGMDAILVGDSLGNVVLGYETTLPVTMEDMLRHVGAVARASRSCLVIADMPFLSYQTGRKQAIENAGKLLQAGAQAVKVEGGAAVSETVAHLVMSGIPVMGHLGMLPQSVNTSGGYRMYGKTLDSVDQLKQEAHALEESGVFSIVLELVASETAREISRELEVPTIGIGAGPDTDGQVLVVTDLLGMDDRFTPRHAKKYANLSETMKNAFSTYAQEVKNGVFPER